MARGGKPIQWVRVVAKIWKGSICPEQDMFEIHNMGRYKQEIACVIAPIIGEQGLRREAERKEVL